MINMGQAGLVSYTDLFGDPKTGFPRFFYVFVPEEYRERVSDMRIEVCRLFA
jgi:hypothetical protein